MNQLEGMFRSFEGKVTRSKDGLMKEVDRILSQTEGDNMEQKINKAMANFLDNAIWNKGDAAEDDTNAEADNEPGA
eukprot:727616-Karenia_brevis.AAC.1